MTGGEMWRRLWSLMRRDRLSAELEEEMRHHVAMRTEKLRAAGLADQDARDEAHRRFGHTVRVGEQSRDQWGWTAAEAILQDTRYALRGFVKQPGFAIVIVATLALGLGVNAAVFSLLDRLFARPPAGVTAPGELRRLYVSQSWSFSDRTVRDAFNYPQWLDLHNAAGANTDIMTYGLDSVRLGDASNARRVVAAFVDASYWRVLGTRVAIGRAFAEDETHIDAPVNVAIVSDAFWRRELGARSDVVGAPLRLGTLTYTVIGVAPRGFAGIDLDDAELWLPLGALPMPTFSNNRWWAIRSTPLLHAVARLPMAIGTTPPESRLTAAFRAGSVGYGYKNDTAAVISTGPILSALGPMKPDRATMLSTRLAVVSILVLVIACANVGNLLLARAVRRRREIAVRLALGISRRRLAVQTMIDSVLLALGAALAATVAGAWTGVGLRRLLLPRIHWRESMLDWRIMVVTGGAALLAGLATGLVPLGQARHLDVTDTLKSGRDTTLRGRRTRTALVIAQTALAVVLLAGAGLFVQSLRRVLGIDVGYDVDRVLLAEPRFVDARGGVDESRARETSASLDGVARRLSASADVQGVALAYISPMGGYMMSGVRVPGLDSVPTLNNERPSMNAVSPEYLSVVGMHLLRGRAITSGDVEGAPPVMLVNETMARTIWPGQDAIGKSVDPFGPQGLRYTIVGIVADAHRVWVVEKPSMHFYIPLAQASLKGARGRATSLIVRARANRVGPAIAATESAVRAVMPTAAPGVVSLRGSFQAQFRTWRIGATLFSALGMLALVVAALGVYGVISYDVGQRTHEMGIRIALGAQRARVLRLVVGHGVRTTTLGVIAGLGLALAGGHLVSALLYETSPSSPVVLAAVAATMLAVAVLAAFFPGWRAAGVDPSAALRAD
jgi:predicted permease